MQDTIRIFYSTDGDWAILFFNEEKLYENHNLDFSHILPKMIKRINENKKELIYKEYEIDEDGFDDLVDETLESYLNIADELD